MRQRIIIIAAAAVVLIGAIIFLWPHKAVKPVKIAKKKAVAAAPAPRPAKAAKVVIVMDDFGYNMNNLDTFFSINEPVTLSVLPEVKYSAAISEKARSKGYEVILHLPLEPHRKDVKEEADTINGRMTESEIISKLAREVKSVPGLTGVSNHMGSKATEDKRLMAIIFGYLKKQNLFFFDSMTSEKSVCREVAKSVGLKYARRDIFLDNTDDLQHVEKQLAALERIALRRGSAIAVCHDRKNTITALAKAMPGMARNGIEFVKLSEMVR